MIVQLKRGRLLGRNRVHTIELLPVESYEDVNSLWNAAKAAGRRINQGSIPNVPKDLSFGMRKHQAGLCLTLTFNPGIDEQHANLLAEEIDRAVRGH